MTPAIQTNYLRPVIDEYAKTGGPLPQVGPIAESFWAGYNGIDGVRKGIGGSIQRHAWLAGKARNEAEPGLKQ